MGHHFKFSPLKEGGVLSLKRAVLSPGDAMVSRLPTCRFENTTASNNHYMSHPLQQDFKREFKHNNLCVRVFKVEGSFHRDDSTPSISEVGVQ